MNTLPAIKVSGENKPSVTFVLHSHICGGAERHLVTLIKGLYDRGYRVAFCGPSDSWLADQLKSHNIPCYHVPLNGYFDLYSLLLIALHVLRFKTDLLHGHMTRGALYAAWAARLTGRISVSTAHLMDSYLRFNLTDKIIAVSKAVKDQLVDRGISDSKIEVIYNGISLPQEDQNEREAVRVALDIKRHETALCMVSFLELFKGHDLAFEALHRLNRRDVKLVVIGRTEGVNHYETLRALAERLGLQDQVLFLGHRDDVYRLLFGMDIFLMPSRREAFSMAAVEAAACNLPVITANVGGIPEVFSDGSTALFFENGDADQLYQSIRRLLDDAALRHQLGSKARLSVSSRFSASRMVDSTIALYETLIESSSQTKAKTA